MLIYCVRNYSLDFHVSAKKKKFAWSFQKSSYLVTMTRREMCCILATSYDLTSSAQRKGHPHITSLTFTQNPKLWYSLVARRRESFGCPLKQCARVGDWLSHLQLPQQRDCAGGNLKETGMGSLTCACNCEHGLGQKWNLLTKRQTT